MQKLALHVFRRDLRLHDNTALNTALTDSENVLPIFIFDPRQVKSNQYKAENCIQFMLESLVDLEEQLKLRDAKLYYFYGESEQVVKMLLNNYPIDAVYFNKDYTPFSKNRDEKIEQICRELKRRCSSFDDALINKPGDVLSGAKTPYIIFTHFFNKSKTIQVNIPKKLCEGKFYTTDIKEADINLRDKILINRNQNIFINGGRKQAISVLKSLENFTEYKLKRDFPALNATTGLSAHNKFGTVSIREVYKQVKEKLGLDHTIIQELYWRDFFTHIAYFFPHVFGNAFNSKYQDIEWSNNQDYFKAWSEGKTGFPIVDAGMRQLNQTGFMHNRVRMITASFLVKDLQIDWRWGEKYFATKLIDYDPAVNNGNWQWAASTGCDAQPYFRIFNPWLQQKKFDFECEYIKRWVPELAGLTSKQIHSLEFKGEPCYSKQIVNHQEAKNYTLEIYSTALSAK